MRYTLPLLALAALAACHPTPAPEPQLWFVAAFSGPTPALDAAASGAGAARDR